MTQPRQTERNIRITRALLVDDDPLMLTVMSDLLRDQGVTQITTAKTGNDGIEALDRLIPSPDLIVCDLHMPNGDGFQFMERLAERRFDGGVILASGMDNRVLNSATLMARFHSLRVLATLSKPVDSAELGAALAKML